LLENPLAVGAGATNRAASPGPDAREEEEIGEFKNNSRPSAAGRSGNEFRPKGYQVPISTSRASNDGASPSRAANPNHGATRRWRA